MTSHLIGTVEVAELLGIDRSVVVRRVQSGRLKVVGKMPGTRGSYVFDRADIETQAETK